MVLGSRDLVWRGGTLLLGAGAVLAFASGRCLELDAWRRAQSITSRRWQTGLNSEVPECHLG